MAWRARQFFFGKSAICDVRFSYHAYRHGQHRLCLGPTAKLRLYKMNIRVTRRLIVFDGGGSFRT